MLHTPGTTFQSNNGSWGILGRTLPFDTPAQVRERLIAANPLFAAPGVIVPAPWGAFGTAGPIAEAPFRSPVENYYLSNAICRASPIMAQCVAEIMPQIIPEAAE
jgi:NADH-quinone oxidoreductase subunit G